MKRMRKKSHVGGALLIIELIVFILVGWLIGFGWALLLLVLTSIAGLIMLRKNMAFFMKQRAQPDPTRIMEMLDRSMFMLSGFLLFMPGFVTDFFGVLCLIPRVRHFLAIKFAPKMPRGHAANGGQSSSKQGVVIQGEYWKEDDKEEKDHIDHS